MSSTVYVDLEPDVWKPVATGAGIVTAQLQDNRGTAYFYAGDAIPTGNVRDVPAIFIQSPSQMPTMSEKALVWARGTGRLVVMTIDV